MSCPSDSMESGRLWTCSHCEEWRRKAGVDHCAIGLKPTRTMPPVVTRCPDFWRDPGSDDDLERAPA